MKRAWITLTLMLLSACGPRTETATPTSELQEPCLLIVDYRDMDDKSVEGVTEKESMLEIKTLLIDAGFNLPGGSCKPDLWFFFLDRKWDDGAFEIVSDFGICTGTMNDRPEKVQLDFAKLVILVEEAPARKVHDKYITEIVDKLGE